MRQWLAGLAICLAPCLAHAQLLDFDAVCGSPPCAIASLYAPVGVTISPPDTQIVAAGTHGLIGVIGGGRYLAAATFPYNVTITLARQATFFTMHLSRGSSSSGPVTVSVTWLKAGVPVNTANVVLTTVNAWSVATATVPGGFDSIVLDPSGGPDRTFGIDGLQFGGACNGFSDVQSSDSFCNATEWLANRGVTLGCVAGQYCPGQNVTRAQMALFMQRLGDAVVPMTLHLTGSAFGSSTFDPICTSSAIPPATHIRVATLWSTSSFYALSGSQQLDISIMMSTDNGSSWQPAPGYPMYVLAKAAEYILAPESAIVTMSPGISYRFGVGYVTNGNDPVVIECEMLLHVQPAKSGATAPFDAPG